MKDEGRHRSKVVLDEMDKVVIIRPLFPPFREHIYRLDISGGTLEAPDETAEHVAQQTYFDLSKADYEKVQRLIIEAGDRSLLFHGAAEPGCLIVSIGGAN